MYTCVYTHVYTLRNKVFETHQIWCAFTVPPSTPDMVFMAEVYLSRHIMVSSTHSCSGLSTPDLVCFYSTSRHTQYGVHSTPRVLCPEWQMLECSTHPLWYVLYTRCRAAHHSPECALDTAVNTVHTRFYTKYSVQCTQKKLHYSNVCIASDKNEVEA